jgi:metal-responsive CopG/Arc/MetJ family transcriptional regulator
MPRTIIDIPAAQLRDFDAHCRSLGLSRAEGVRRAIQSFLQAAPTLQDDGFGLWRRGASHREADTEHRESVR